MISSVYWPVRLWLLSPLTLALGAGLWTGAEPIMAQTIAPAADGTGTVVHVQGTQTEITGGQLSGDGANLFHSFQEFGINAGDRANFRSNPQIQTILGRVTGGNASTINGILSVTGGTSNLYLINPAGILFGRDVRLDLPGSFTATTATGVWFGDTLFAAEGVSDYATLVGTPSGFQFAGDQPGAIANLGSLDLTTGQNLHLIGGTVVAGNVAVPNGNLVISSVPGSSRVRISQPGQVLGLEIEPALTPANVPNTINPLDLPTLLTGIADADLAATGLVRNPTGTLQLTGTDVGVHPGDVTVNRAIAHQALIQADQNLALVGSEIGTNQNLSLVAQNTLYGRDTVGDRLLFWAGADLQLQGDQAIDLFALSDPGSGVVAGGDLRLSSANPIIGDAHFYSGGSTRFETLEGGLNTVLSPNDPIIRAAGDVALASYTGASLHVIAGGSITVTGDIVITGADAANGLVETDVGTITGASSAFNIVNIDGAANPTVDLRAGTLNVGTPGSTPPAIAGLNPDPPTVTAIPTASDIVIGGNISILPNVRSDANATNVLLTNQYQPNLALNNGNITFANLNLFADGNAPGNALTGQRNVAVLSRGTITGGNIDTTGVNNNQFTNVDGRVLIEAGQTVGLGTINTSSDNTGGTVVINAGQNLTTTAINTSASTGAAIVNAGAGTIALSTGQTLAVPTINATGFNANGGQVSLTAGQAVQVNTINTGAVGNVVNTIAGGRVDVGGVTGANAAQPQVEMGTIDTSASMAIPGTGAPGGAEAIAGAVQVSSQPNSTGAVNQINASAQVIAPGNGIAATATAGNVSPRVRFGTVIARAIAQTDGVARATGGGFDGNSGDNRLSGFQLVDTSAVAASGVAAIAIGGDFTSGLADGIGIAAGGSVNTSATASSTGNATATAGSLLINPNPIQNNTNAPQLLSLQTITASAAASSATGTATATGGAVSLQIDNTPGLSVVSTGRQNRNLQFSSITTEGFATGSAVTGIGGNVLLYAPDGTVRGLGFVPGFGDTIRAVGTTTGGTIDITHDGGVTNVPFIVGDASINGTAGGMVTTGGAIAPTTPFPDSGTVTPAPGITITYENELIPSSLSDSFVARLIDPDVDESSLGSFKQITFRLAEFIPFLDGNADTTITITWVGNPAVPADEYAGLQFADGRPVVPGTVIATNDVLVFTPSDDRTLSEQGGLLEFFAFSDGLDTELYTLDLFRSLPDNNVLPPLVPITPLPTLPNLPNSPPPNAPRPILTPDGTVVRLGRCPGSCRVERNEPLPEPNTTLNLNDTTATPTLEGAQEILQNIANETGIKPALLYVGFVPRTVSIQPGYGELEATQSEEITDRLNRDRQTGGIAIDLEPKPDDELELLLIPVNGQPIRRRLAGVTRAQVDDVVKEFQQRVGTVGRRRFRHYETSAAQLYDWMITPIAAALETHEINNIAFIMSTGLRSLPVAALYDGERFLIEQYSLGLMPSLSLANTNYLRIQDSQVLAMGTDTFVEQNPLPAVPVELQIIAEELWFGVQVLGDEFTANRLRELRDQTPYGIVHLATHGEFAPGELSNSYIQFSDRRVGLDELGTLNLVDPATELLVLSACRTAVGNVDAELGFAGSALQAGVKTVLGSLWYVSDEGTLALMTQFYDQLQDAPIKAEALRQAQIAMLRGEVRVENGQLLTRETAIALPENLENLSNLELNHPYYWSAFTLVGSPW